MSKVGIITDSIHGLPDEIIKRYGIQIAPMGVIINNKAYRDTFDITSTRFYSLFKEARTPSSTNAATPGDFLSIYSSLLKTTDNMVYIGVSKALTATFKVAEQTRELFLADHPEAKIELIDSKNCMGALGFLVLEAAKAAEAGKSLPEIVKMVQDMMPKVKYLSILDTLRYLIKIGRIPKTAASDEKLRFRPVIGMTNNSGVMENFPPVETDRAVEKLVELAGKYIDSHKPVKVIIHHSEYLEEAEQLKQMVISRFKPVELYVSDYSPAALSSTGLMTGISFYS
jgi:DegV family protein with EDD domain